MQLFFQNAQAVLLQLAGLYLIVGMGIAVERLTWFPEATAKRCTQLLLYLVTPCVIVKSFFAMEYSTELLHNLGIALLGGVLLHAAGIALAWHGFRGKRHPDTDPILHYGAVYGNCGYLALPLAQAMVGNLGVFYVSIVVLTFQVTSFTHGEFVMAGGAIKGQRARGKKQEAEKIKFQWKKLFFNAGTIAVLIGFPLYLLQVDVPALLRFPVESVAAMNTPLAMLTFGTYLSRTKFNAILRNRKIFLAAAVKLLAMPAVLMAALLLAGVRGPLLHSLLIPAAAPCANNTVIFAAKYERDAGYAAQVVALFSLASIATMPLVIALALTPK